MKPLTKMHWMKKILSWTIILIVLAALVAIILFCFDFINCWKWILLVIGAVYAIDFFLIFYIFFSSKRTDKEKKCWILINIFLIGIGPLLFIKYGYYAYYDNHDEVIKSLSKKINKMFNLSSFKTKDQVINKLSNYASNSTESCLSSGNIEKIKNLESLYELTINMIRKAKKIILIDFYIIGDSIWLKSIINELIIKLHEGVKIFIQYDPFGSKKKIPYKIFQELKKIGFEISEFKQQESCLVTAIDNNRSHKKSLIIDGNEALYGGINLSDEYLNFNNKYHYWYDEAYYLTGNIVNELIKTYLIDWIIYGNNNFDLLSLIDSLKIIKQKSNNKNYMQIYNANPENNDYRMHHFISLAFSNAKKRIWINTPYLYLSEALIDQLISLSKAGIEIKLVLPYHYDNKKFILAINEIQYQKLIDNGIEIYELDGFNHRKSMIIDDLILIGTTNLDQRALCLNYENTIFIKDKMLLSSLEKEFKDSFSKANSIRKKPNKPLPFYYKIFVKLLMITETLL